MVLRLTYGGRSVLLTGDIEREAETYLQWEQPAAIVADVVKVPHHGSSGASSAAFVDATRGTLAVISCGRDNRFQFPARAVERRWSALGTVHRTDRQGRASVEISKGGELRYFSRCYSH